MSVSAQHGYPRRYIRITSYNVCYTKLLRDFVREALAEYQEQQNLQQAVSDKLAESKWAVSDELIENGIEEYRMRGGRVNAGDIADFIEDSYLSDEAEPDEPVWEQIESGEVTP